MIDLHQHVFGGNRQAIDTDKGDATNSAFERYPLAGGIALLGHQHQCKVRLGQFKSNIAQSGKGIHLIGTDGDHVHLHGAAIRQAHFATATDKGEVAIDAEQAGNFQFETTGHLNQFTVSGIHAKGHAITTTNGNFIVVAAEIDHAVIGGGEVHFKAKVADGEGQSGNADDRHAADAALHAGPTALATGFGE